ncbi:sigma-54-dependent Fis family transcriptional regulator [bacterium]|nr:sigma-54-dependent Fis family transcriptional regulator [candidate division CSSED10-310 bacterium]
MANKKSPEIFIVDDDTRTGWILSKLLTSEGYRTQSFTSGKDLMTVIRSGRIPHVVLSDLVMPDMTGNELIVAIHKVIPDLPVVIMTAYGTIEHAVNAMKAGAVEFVTKPLNTREIRGIMKNLIRRLETGGDRLRSADSARNIPAERQLIGSCPVFQEALQFVHQFADTNLTVLLRGESGTGKELFARALHELSARKDKPFVPVDCATLPENLLESELFGHERGAFTDAKISRSGKFEIADGGTLFLDEIGNLSLSSQMKILRAIQERTIERLGSTTQHRIDVRIVAATNVDLEKAIDSGAFREDLYFRLNEVTIWLPPLRNRRTDIRLLAGYFLGMFNAEFRAEERAITGFSEDALDVLLRYGWRGNVRELRNVIRRAVILADEVIDVKDLPKEIVRSVERETIPSDVGEMDGDGGIGDGGMDLKEMARREAIRMEKVVILRALEKYGWHLSNTAQALNVDRKTLRTKIREYGIRREGRREERRDGVTPVEKPID